MKINPNWTFEEAKAEHENELRIDPSRELSDPLLPLPQWLAFHSLALCEKRFQGGEKIQLMLALRICANHDLVMPDWVARAYIAGYDKVANARAKSWDSVFGAPYKKGAHLNAIEKKRRLKFAVWNRINDMTRYKLDPPAIDEYLFEEIGKEFNIGKTLASEYYYAVKKLFENDTSAKS